MRLPRAIAGVNIQFIEDGKMQLRTLAAVELQRATYQIGTEEINRTSFRRLLFSS